MPCVEIKAYVKETPDGQNISAVLLRGVPRSRSCFATLDTDEVTRISSGRMDGLSFLPKTASVDGAWWTVPRAQTAGMLGTMMMSAVRVL